MTQCFEEEHSAIAPRSSTAFSTAQKEFSELTRYVERIRQTAPDRLESQTTIEDPETLERAWVLELAYTRATGLDRLVHDAFDNGRSELADGLFTIIPPQR
jgi:uncharacterized protein YegJ (DUF2314 family)